jgi:hypothetical protein
MECEAEEIEEFVVWGAIGLRWARTAVTTAKRSWGMRTRAQVHACVLMTAYRHCMSQSSRMPHRGLPALYARCKPACMHMCVRVLVGKRMRAHQGVDLCPATSSGPACSSRRRRSHQLRPLAGGLRARPRTRQSAGPWQPPTRASSCIEPCKQHHPCPAVPLGSRRRAGARWPRCNAAASARHAVPRVPSKLHHRDVVVPRF